MAFSADGKGVSVSAHIQVYNTCYQSAVHGGNIKLASRVSGLFNTAAAYPGYKGTPSGKDIYQMFP